MMPLFSSNQSLRSEENIKLEEKKKKNNYDILRILGQLKVAKFILTYKNTIHQM